VDARAFIRDMHEAAVSTRSACSSGSAEASHVLKAMGLSDEEAFASVRFSLGRATTRPDLDRTVELAAASWRKLRGIAEGRENAAGA
jgi:cysteine desulfurase